MQHNEHNLQVACVQWLDYQYPSLLRTISPILKCSVIQGKRQKDLGYASGSPDLIIFEARQGYHGLCVEFKAGKNKQSDKQKEWELGLFNKGYKYALIYNFDDFVSLINWYMKGE